MTTAQPWEPPPSVPPRRRRWLSVLLALCIFACGAVVGGSAALVALRNHIVHTLHHPEVVPRRIAAHLRFQVGLSEEQTRQVEAILRRRQEALQTIRREVQPRVMVELDRVESEVGDVLDDAQREKWHKMFTRLRNTWIPSLPEK